MTYFQLCFNCRSAGHKLSECPEIQKDVEQGTGICFKCGSTEHSSAKCNLKLPAGKVASEEQIRWLFDDN